MKRDIINCLRCSTPMRFQGEQQIQLGKTGWILGDLSNLLAGAMHVAVFQCPECGKLEFFNAEEPYAQYGDKRENSRRICPECGAEYDGNGTCCPICGHEDETELGNYS